MSVADEIRKHVQILESVIVPKPYRIEYPYGLPGDSFRHLANNEYKATAVVKYRSVDPKLLRSRTRPGNRLRYDPGQLAIDMRLNGYTEGTPLIVYVSVDGDARIGEGNHRLVAAISAGIEVPVEIRYLWRSDENESFKVFPYDHKDPSIKVISD